MTESLDEQEIAEQDEPTRVDMIASGYEWECPECETLNTEIAYKPNVQCKTCGATFETNLPEHAID